MIIMMMLLLEWKAPPSSPPSSSSSPGSPSAAASPASPPSQPFLIDPPGIEHYIQDRNHNQGQVSSGVEMTLWYSQRSFERFFVGSQVYSFGTLSTILKIGQFSFKLEKKYQPGSDSLCGFPSFLLFNAAFLQKLVMDETLNTDVKLENISRKYLTRFQETRLERKGDLRSNLPRLPFRLRLLHC